MLGREKTRKIMKKTLKYSSLVAGVAALAPVAHGNVVTVNVNQTIASNGTPYDLTANGGPDLTFSAPAAGLYAYANVTGSPTAGYTDDGLGNPVDVAGSTIGPSNSFASGTGAMATCKFLEGCSGNFPTDGSTQYLGFEWSPSSGVTDYGYVTLSISGSKINAASIDLQSFTYDDSGASITAPAAAPEPASFALMAAGAAGIAALRMRRRARNS